MPPLLPDGIATTSASDLAVSREGVQMGCRPTLVMQPNEFTLDA